MDIMGRCYVLTLLGVKGLNEVKKSHVCNVVQHQSWQLTRN